MERSDGALDQIIILMKGGKCPEKQETFPGEVPKGRHPKMPLR